jgi:hypothetical protein
MKALFAGSSLDIRVDIPNLLAKLVITILVPSVAGKVRALARGSSPVAQPPAPQRGRRGSGIVATAQCRAGTRARQGRRGQESPTGKPHGRVLACRHLWFGGHGRRQFPHACPACLS